MTSAAPRFAILIATLDRSEKIGRLLASILAVDAGDFEAVVLDQSDDDCTAHVVRTVVGDDPRFTYVHSSKEGLSRARNIAATLTTAPYLIVADDDCIVPPNWLEELTLPFEEDERVGVVFCTVVPVPFDVPGHTPHVTFEHERRCDDVRDAWRAARRGLPLGAGMAVRRSAFEDVGGFDEQLGPGAPFGAVEDSDLSWRTILRGWTTVHRPTPVVVHDGFRDLDAFRDLVRRDLVGVGGTLSKYMRSGSWSTRWGAAALLVRWMVRLGIVEPSRHLLAGRKPTGLRRPLLLLRGAFMGFRTPIEREQLCFQPRSDVPSGSPTVAG